MMAGLVTPDASNRTVVMTVARSDGRVIITLVGQSAAPCTVAYALNVSGGSTTHHAGRTRIDAHPRILSQVSVATSGAGEAILQVTEECGASYSDSVQF